ncbi:RHS repeat-associated core domain-containing protein, partial [Brevundimonas sp.]|uniref:RHS repeat-associated core domain-containing protein n=1 Tax=Brevundimonas sp. TaxID=1871086 RepID=UPI002D57FFEE
EPLVWYEGATLTDRRWLHADAQGSIIATSGASGAILGQTYRYSPYGEPDADYGFSGGSRFRYTGQITLRDAPLWHYKARVYDPGIGRFLQTDPVGYADQMNLHAYVGNDPVNGTDPTGMLTSSSSPFDPNCYVDCATEEDYEEYLQTFISSVQSGGRRTRRRGWVDDALETIIEGTARSVPIDVYRVCSQNDDPCREGTYWTPEDPREMADWRDRLAVYPGWNSGEYLAIGQVTFWDLRTGRVQVSGLPGSVAGPQPYNPGLGGGPYEGRGTEWRIRDPANTVTGLRVIPFRRQR